MRRRGVRGDLHHTLQARAVTGGPEIPIGGPRGRVGAWARQERIAVVTRDGEIAAGSHWTERRPFAIDLRSG